MYGTRVADKRVFSLFTDGVLTQRVAVTGAAAVHIELNIAASW